MNFPHRFSVIAMILWIFIALGILCFSSCTAPTKQQENTQKNPPSGSGPSTPPDSVPPPPQKQQLGPQPPAPPPLDAHVQAYLNSYVTSFGDEAAPLDLAWSNPASQHVVGDLRCRELFGTDRPKDFEKSSRSKELMFKEYLAGQILTALSFPTTRLCFFKNNANTLEAYYRKGPSLQPGFVPEIKAANRDISKGGIKVANDIYVQTLFQYHVPKINKWLVAETDYGNNDYFAFLLSHGLATSFAFDFEHAGQEDQNLNTRSVMSTIYNNIGALKDDLITKEMIFAFTKQLKDFIKDKPGENETSILAKIVLGPQAQHAKNDFASNLDLPGFFQKIKSQITALISELEQRDPADVGFEQREQMRATLADDLAQRTIPNFDKKTFRLALLGKYYVNNPSDIAELQALDRDVLANLERNRLKHVVIYNPITPKEMALSFAYPTNRNYCLITQGTNNHFEAPVLTAIKSNLQNFTLHKEVNIQAVNLRQDVESCIDQGASLIVVGFYDASMPAFNIDKAPQLANIFTWYKNKHATTLPRYIISAGRNQPDHGQKGENYAYKNSAGSRIILYPVVDKTSGFSLHGVSIDAGLTQPPPYNLAADPVNLETLLQFIKDNSQ